MSDAGTTALHALAQSRERLPLHLRRGPVAVAVSGGADSVALLTLLHALPEAPALVVLHVDHGLRQDSGADAAFVRDLARRLGLPCRVHALWMQVPPGRSPETRAPCGRTSFRGSSRGQGDRTALPKSRSCFGWTPLGK